MVTASGKLMENGQMKKTMSIASVVFTIGFGTNETKAEPSFDCSRNLNRTESVICDDVLLGNLDREMVRFFFQARDGAIGARRDDLVSEQQLWLRWRDTCGDDGQCIRRRYEQRIIDLAPPNELPVTWQPGSIVNPQSNGSTSTDPDQIVARRVTDNRYEVEFADGTVHWQAFNGTSFGTDYPDGTGSSAQLSQAPPAEFPSLPGAYLSWGEDVETSLQGIIDRMLSPADRDRYRTLASSKPYSIRVYDHIRVIDFLTNR